MASIFTLPSSPFEYNFINPNPQEAVFLGETHALSHYRVCKHDEDVAATGHPALPFHHGNLSLSNPRLDLTLAARFSPPD